MQRIREAGEDKPKRKQENEVRRKIRIFDKKASCKASDTLKIDLKPKKIDRKKDRKRDND